LSFFIILLGEQPHRLRAPAFGAKRLPVAQVETQPARSLAKHEDDGEGRKIAAKKRKERKKGDRAGLILPNQIRPFFTNHYCFINY
jgi:hypothetical protein